MDAIPPLVDIVRETLHAKDEGSEPRQREAAVHAIQEITGWDPQVDPFGRLRTKEKTAEAVIEECTLTP